ncbi:glycosyl transferase family 1 [Thermopolyspora flexuosa]|uniref:Phosphatidylinositol alpha-1,6-mannosyltransferase n=1 Tax=Thermopolyspora flexuosa TaxID=103836 RepID=A0A543IZY9_9ACTN|nr:glycosyltransferase family 4 protein [Thermopolyspora flexuosa]TQM76130.1 phosphatidylinositol alpha-1,6-mannosyltransferase [Thermopolyspora flexuosa]GGM64954.1 glycosyl transferase family 1 [Thermopolyspora flexuosa]
MSTLIVTNDFPPRPGGIQAFVHALAVRRPPGSVVVYAPRWKGCEAFDARQPYRVVRHPTSLMLPVPSVARRAARLVREHGCDTVVFGAALPMGLLAPALRQAGARRVVMLTHGHEAAWAGLGVGRALLRRIAEGADVVTYLGGYTFDRLSGPIPPEKLVRLTPGVDTEVFRPGAGGAEIRAALGLGDRPVVVCVSRLVPRKGQDMLIRVWPEVLRAAPGAFLLLVGGGPYRRTLERMIASLGLGGSVLVTGTVPWGRLPAYYDAGDVFAMPCRTRRWGMDVEGLGIVYLEASATGLPVVAGNSGGAPDAVVPGQTGLVVDGGSPDEVADALIGLLKDPAGARAMGERGRAWIEREWRWDAVADRFAALLSGAADLKDAGADP